MCTIKGSMFSELALLNKLKTREILSKKLGRYVGGYHFCDENVEPADHIFICCSLASQIWSLVCYFLGFFDPPERLTELYSSWVKLSFSSMMQYSAARMPVAAICWSFWAKRNTCIFLNKQSSVEGMARKAILLISDWSILCKGKEVSGLIELGDKLSRLFPFLDS